MRPYIMLFVNTFVLLTMTKDLNTENTGTQHFKDKNPLLENWEGSFNGYPAFDKVKVADFIPAFEEGMKEKLSETNYISTNIQPPTFKNTILPLERAGAKLDRVERVYDIWNSTMKTPDFAKVEKEMAPRISAFNDQIILNSMLYDRIATVYTSQEFKTLTPEQQRLTWLIHTKFVRAGAKLDEKSKASLSKINQQLANAFTRFSQNLLGDENELEMVIDKESDLAGLPQSLKDAASSAASKKYPGKWAISNTRSSIDPFLTYSDRRELREKAWRMFVNRGDNGEARDNNATITEILQLRVQRAKLLGYKTHAHWRLENSMAKTPEAALKLLEDVWKPAVKRVHEEVADMQVLSDKEGAKIKIEPWDYRYYAEKVRKAKYDLDQNEVKQYMQLDKLREGMFWVAGELFNFNFKPVENVPVYHPDVKVWVVNDKTSGKQIGLWYFDPYARSGKRSGAWMNAYRLQQKMNGDITTIVSNNSNFVKGKPGEPVLISWDDATTLFHEFGHALHGLSSNVTYPSLAGTQVFRDYVEFPSQLLEHWLSTPEVLQRFALHYQTGKPIPKTLVQRIKNASTFNEGFKTTEYLSSAIIDMKLHLAGDVKIDPDKFERETLTTMGMPKELVMRHRTPQFQHVFGSDSYSAGYYSYLWSDVLTADAYGAFVEAGGPYSKNVAKKLRQYIFSVGNTVDPAIGYRNFRGRDPGIEALMIKRGFKSK